MFEIAKELVRIAKQLVSIQFDTKQQMDKYLKEHPNADKRNHSVKKQEKKVQNKDTEEIRKIQDYFGTSSKNVAQTTKDSRVLQVLSKSKNRQTIYQVTQNKNTNSKSLNNIVDSKYSNDYIKCKAMTHKNFDFNRLQNIGQGNFEGKNFSDKTKDVLSEFAYSILTNDTDRSNEILREQRYK